MQVNSLLGLAGLIVVGAVAVSAIKNGTLTSEIFTSATSGFSKVLNAVTQTKTA